MSTRKKIGMILVLVGSFWFLISFVLISGYSPVFGFIGHLNYMTTIEIVLKEGRWLRLPDGYVEPPIFLPTIVPRFNIEPLTPKTPYSDALKMENWDKWDSIMAEIKKGNQEDSKPIKPFWNLRKLEPAMPMDEYLQLREELNKFKGTKEYQEKYVEPLKNFSPHYEGRIVIPYKYLFILNIAIIFTGLGMLILSSKRLQD